MREALKIFRQYRIDALFAGNKVPNQLEAVTLICGPEATKSGIVGQAGHQVIRHIAKIEESLGDRAGSLPEIEGINALSRYIDR